MHSVCVHTAVSSCAEFNSDNELSCNLFVSQVCRHFVYSIHKTKLKQFAENLNIFPQVSILYTTTLLKRISTTELCLIDRRMLRGISRNRINRLYYIHTYIRQATVMYSERNETRGRTENAEWARAAAVVYVFKCTRKTCNV